MQKVYHNTNDTEDLDNLTDFFSFNVKATMGMMSFQIYLSAPQLP